MLILSVTTEIYILLLANRKSNIPPKFIFPDIFTKSFFCDSDKIEKSGRAINYKDQ